MPDFKQYIGKLLPSLKTFAVARKDLRDYRASHFRLLSSLLTPGPGVFEDRPRQEIESINQSSKKYFEQSENHEFWLNRPFSDPDTVGKYLWRFGLLLSALRIRPGDRVLDFGCGTGWTSIMLARTGAEVVGMDIAPAALDIACEASGRELPADARERLRFQEYSGDRIDAPDHDFDFVVVFDAFHHFPNPMAVLREFHRVLSPHGRFGFAEPGAGHAETEAALTEAKHGILEQDLDLEQFYRSGRAAGFKGLEMLVPALEPEILTLPVVRMRSFLRGLSWLVPADFHRKAVLTAPIGIFANGPYPVTSLNPRTHVAHIRPAVARLSVPCGDQFSIAAHIKNRTETVWLREGRRGRGYVRLGAHLLHASGKTVELDYGRAELPTDLPKGGAIDVELRLQAPSTPGQYRIRLDMVNEGICWFAQRGSQPADIRLEVTSS